MSLACGRIGNKAQRRVLERSRRNVLSCERVTWRGGRFIKADLRQTIINISSSRGRSRTMTISSASCSRMTVTEVGDFLRNPPPEFSVERVGSGYRVHSDPERSLVLIDDLDLCRGKVVFQNSLGRWGKHLHGILHAHMCLIPQSRCLIFFPVPGK